MTGSPGPARLAAGGDRAVRAYCAPGRRAYAALILALHGALDVTAIEETPHLDGGTVIVIPDPVSFTLPGLADEPPRRPPPTPFITRPGDLFRLGSLA